MSSVSDVKSLAFCKTTQADFGMRSADNNEETQNKSENSMGFVRLRREADCRSLNSFRPP